MSRPPSKSADFLSKLRLDDEPEPKPAGAPQSAPKTETKAKPIGRPPKRPGGSRAGLKHLGGYVDDATAEKFALLRIRLKKGNDELISIAVDALYRAESAKRKFGD